MRNMLKGRYQLEGTLNTGGMSIIYLALDVQTNERVVIKIMTAIQEDDKRNQKAQERFQREITIARDIKHPHVLSILDAGYILYEQHEVPFLVTRYIEEGSLADYIEHRPPWQHWTLQQTADAVLQAAQSLDYLHTRKPPIVHQDVKPGNFLYYSVNSPQRAVYLYLCDFGISRLQQSEHAFASEVIGTAAYMAPEQLRSHVMPASDQYALAIMTCQLLTGKLPLQAQTNQQYAEAHLHEPPVPPSQLNPQRIPRASEVDQVILRALEKTPERRYPTTLAFGQVLMQALSKLTPTSPLTDLEGTGRGAGYHNGQVIPPKQNRQVEPIAPIAFDPPDTTGNQGLDEPLPARPAKATAVSERGAAAPAHLRLHSPVAISLPARPKLLYWSSDGNSLACILYAHAPIYIRPPNRVQAANVRDGHQATSASWSADGHVLAIATRETLRFWDTIEHAELSLTLALPRPIESLHWSVRGKLAIWADSQVLLYTIAPAQLRASQLTPPQLLDAGPIRSSNADTLRWSPDGLHLAAGGNNGDIICWQPDNAGRVWHVAALKQKIMSLAWSPDSTLLLVGLRNNQVIGWNMHTRQQILHWTNLPIMPRTISIARNGRIVLASSAKTLLCGFPSETSPTAIVEGQLLAAWSPTRRELATLDIHNESTLVLWHE